MILDMKVSFVTKTRDRHFLQFERCYSLKRKVTFGYLENKKCVYVRLQRHMIRQSSLKSVGCDVFAGNYNPESPPPVVTLSKHYQWEVMVDLRN